MDIAVVFVWWAVGTLLGTLLLWIVGRITKGWGKGLSAVIAASIAIALIWCFVYSDPEQAKDVAGMARNGSLLLVKLAASVGAIAVALLSARLLPPP